MSKSVLDLQNDCLNNSIPCSQLLLKAYAIARKLNSKQMVDFCKKELNGFQNNPDEIPPYRTIRINLRAFNNFEWKSVIVPNNSYLSVHNVAQSEKELEALCSQEQNYFTIKLSTEEINILKTACNNKNIVDGAKRVPAYLLEGIIFKIRYIILEWALKLGEDGIWGENLEFTTEEQEKAKSTSSIQIIVNGSVTNSNFAGILEDSALNIQSQDKSK